MVQAHRAVPASWDRRGCPSCHERAETAAGVLSTTGRALVQWANLGGWQVDTVVAGKALRKPVRIGLGNLLQVQGTSGLKPGELAIVAPRKTWWAVTR